VAFPMGPYDFKGGYHSGPGWGFAVALEAAPCLEAVLEIDRHVFPLDRAYFFDAVGLPDDGASTLEGGKTTALLMLFGMRVRPFRVHRKVTPYFIGGVGLAGFGVAEARGTTPYWTAVFPSWTERDLAARAGVGSDFRLDPKNAFFVQADGVTIATLGGATTAVMLRLGMKYFL
jgi:hypothetical protein